MDEPSHLNLKFIYSFSFEFIHFPLLRYAVTSWIPHVIRVEEGGREASPARSLRLFLSVTKNPSGAVVYYP